MEDDDDNFSLGSFIRRTNQLARARRTQPSLHSPPLSMSPPSSDTIKAPNDEDDNDDDDNDSSSSQREEYYSRPFIPAISRILADRPAWRRYWHILKLVLSELRPDGYMVLALGVFLLPVPVMYFDEIKSVAVGVGTWVAGRFARGRR